MLSEAPNNNDITLVENMVLNEAPNSDDAKCVASNLHLTTMGAQQFSMMANRYCVGVTNTMQLYRNKYK